MKNVFARERFLTAVATGIALATTTAASAGFSAINTYSIDVGGNNPDGPGGLSAQAIFTIDGNELTILLRNTSDGTPSTDVSNTLLVSLGFNLTDGVSIISGDSALIAPGSTGLGAWSGLGAGDSVAEQWLWTNDFGGDMLGQGELLESSQIITTSNGLGGGDRNPFGSNTNVMGPWGGIAPNPLLLGVPGSQEAVGDAIVFMLTLSDTLTQQELNDVAVDSVVEFGSDFQYLKGVVRAGRAGVVFHRRGDDDTTTAPVIPIASFE